MEVQVQGKRYLIFGDGYIKVSAANSNVFFSINFDFDHYLKVFV
jgi:hypothetical protein